MAGVNKVILLGRLGADPEVKYFESGSMVARVSLATTETYKDRDGNRVESTEWHKVDFWEGLGKIVEQYLKKGDMIYVEGKIKTDDWTDNDGNQRKLTKIRATNMTMLPKTMSPNQQGGGQPQQQSSPQPAGQSQPQPMASSLADDPLKSTDGNEMDDLPF